MTRDQERAAAICDLLSLPDEPVLAGRRTTEPVRMPSEPWDRQDLKAEFARRWLQHRLQDARDESTAKVWKRPRLTVKRRA